MPGPGGARASGLLLGNPLSARGIGRTTRYDGKGRHFGVGVQSTWVPDPWTDWQWDAGPLAAVAWKLVHASPLGAALVEARIALTLGEDGLIFSSRYGARDGQLTDRERSVQRRINGIVESTYEDQEIDAAAAHSRYEVESLLVRSYTILGDGFAVRVMKPARQRSGEAVWRTKWRALDPTRVANPPRVTDWHHPGGEAPAGNVVWRGIELSPNFERTALWVRVPVAGQADDRVMRIPWRAPDGTPNVIHRYQPLRPDDLRGFTLLAPMLLYLAEQDGGAEAYAVAKRIQACHPAFYRGPQPAEAEKNGRQLAQLGPNTTYEPGMFAYLGEDGEITFPNYSYQGSDFSAAMEAMTMLTTSAWQLPWQWVLAFIQGVSMSSGRIITDRVNHVAKRWQNSHIRGCTRKIDRSIVQEAIARRRLDLTSWRAALRGEYGRPQAPDLDPAKTAAAVGVRLGQGDSYTDLFRDFYGVDFASRHTQRRADDVLLRGSVTVRPEGEGSPDGAEPDAESAEGVDDGNPEEGGRA